MQKDGYIIPPLPIVYIQCKNKTEAKQKLLRLNSQYGKMTKESVLEFAEDIELNFDEIALPDTTIDFSGEEAGSEEKEKPDIEFNESYSVVVQCINEEECEEVFNKLTSEGYKCKVSTL
jgi:predicted 3-demethylubiquinone-9 3-methyltransferase (glyoxalase superfamily)